MTRIPCAFSCKKEFLDLVDKRAAALGMNRSAYIVQLLRQDIMSGKPNLNIISQQASIFNGDVINHHNLMVAEQPAVYGKKKTKGKK